MISSSRFAFLAHIQYPQSLGAVSLAVEKVNNDSGILPQTRLEFDFQILYGEEGPKLNYVYNWIPRSRQIVAKLF